MTSKPTDHQAVAEKLIDQARHAATRGAADGYQEAATTALLLALIPRLDRVIELLEKQDGPARKVCSLHGCGKDAWYPESGETLLCRQHTKDTWSMGIEI